MEVKKKNRFSISLYNSYTELPTNISTNRIYTFVKEPVDLKNDKGMLPRTKKDCFQFYINSDLKNNKVNSKIKCIELQWKINCISL